MTAEPAIDAEGDQGDAGTMRTNGAQAGFVSRPLLETSPPPTNAPVMTAMPSYQPSRNAMLVGRGRGVCRTRMPGMIDSGEMAIIQAQRDQFGEIGQSAVLTGAT